jgi:uncharacterized protein YidB (DUF937 family)
MFDRILEHTRLLGLNETQARRLLGMLVAQVFNPRRGGPAGFVQAFRDQGLGATVDSWLGPGPNEPISGERLEQVLGAETLSRMAERLEMPVANARAAAAAMLPDAIHELSEHGDLPESVAGIPERFHGWFGGHRDHLAPDLGHFGAAAIEAGAATLGASVGVVGNAHMAAAAKVADDAGPAATASPAHPPLDPPQSPTPARAGPARPMAIGLLVIVALLVGFAVLRGCSRPADPMQGTGASVSVEVPGLTG